MSIFDCWTKWESLPEAEDNPYEWDSLGELKVHNPVADANHLYDSMKLARIGTSWKASVQRFCWECLPRITRLQQGLDAILTGTESAYAPTDGKEFFANERGRVRPITGQSMDDRVVSHSLNDIDLMPKIRPHLIYDNAASLKHRGVEFARKRLMCHLQRYYQREGTNIGYIRLKDQSKYYDNIEHDKAAMLLDRFTDNEMARRLVRIMLKHAELDVSDLSDELFELAKRVKFDRVKWRLGRHPKRGEKMLRKGVSVGDQLSQTIGVFFPYEVDNEAKIRLRSKYYARYMDDSYDIDRDLSVLRARAKAIDAAADRIGLFTNERKTVIERIDKGFVYLQRKYRLLPDGRVEIRILPKTLTRLRKRIKGLKKFVDGGKISEMEAAEAIRSWKFARENIMSYPQIRRIEILTLNLFGRKAYDYVRNRACKWDETDGADDERRNVRQSVEG